MTSRYNYLADSSSRKLAELLRTMTEDAAALRTVSRRFCVIPRFTLAQVRNLLGLDSEPLQTFRLRYQQKATQRRTEDDAPAELHRSRYGDIEQSARRCMVPSRLSDFGFAIRSIRSLLGQCFRLTNAHAKFYKSWGILHQTYQHPLPRRRQPPISGDTSTIRSFFPLRIV